MSRHTAPIDEPVATDLEAFTVPEVAERLRVGPDWVYDRVRSGELGCIRGTGPKGSKGAIRILPSQLQKFLDDRRVE